MNGDWDDPWVDDLASWEDVADVLRDDWDRVVHPPLGLSLERADGLLAFDERGRWRARHRRGLHRLGFRPVALGGTAVWQWDVRPQLHATDLSQFASPFESIFGPGRSGPTALRLRTLLARDQLVRERAMRVLREVFGVSRASSRCSSSARKSSGATRPTTSGSCPVDERPATQLIRTAADVPVRGSATVEETRDGARSHPCQATPGTSTAQVVTAVRANRWSSVTSGTPSCAASAT